MIGQNCNCVCVCVCMFHLLLALSNNARQYGVHRLRTSPVSVRWDECGRCGRDNQYPLLRHWYCHLLAIYRWNKASKLQLSIFPYISGCKYFVQQGINTVSSFSSHKYPIIIIIIIIIIHLVVCCISIQ